MDFIRTAANDMQNIWSSYGFENRDIPYALLGFNGLLWAEYGVRFFFCRNK